MATFTPSIDFRGARGSNTGDQFHELWALQQVLDLLRPETDLTAVGVEGVRTETPLQNADYPTWDGVDCITDFRFREHNGHQNRGSRLSLLTHFGSAAVFYTSGSCHSRK